MSAHKQKNGRTAWPMKWPIKTIVKELRYARDLSVYLLTREKVRKEPLVRLDEKGLVSPDYTRPVCLFCSYDYKSIVRKNVYQYLDALALAGFNIIFISSSDDIAISDLEKLSRCCVRIINRENKGYDFYGWKTGLEKYARYKDHAGLLLANDSVIGPLFSISNIVTTLENYDADVIGMTDSFQFHPHLQSYFLYCKKNVVLSEEFLRFFKEVDILELKNAVIRKYEVGFSRLLRHRFRLAALYGLEPALARTNFNQRPIRWIEPTLHLWKPLITEFKFPFIKKSVLTRKGVSVGEVLPVLIETASHYNMAILDDLSLPYR
ncbi:Rhamnan synthesis protein F [Nitrosospira sp. Nsp11]|uniref:rhamnan synthesis F family protein n=1 Tax=Nitrosospira sp. Nsp11 TaxID=1855338 RepID=UPI00091487A1|nr:rhamnan synthesis F family protein [Nitrosospira sp. Nsp11]SHL34511.1 Rhamnan synthesis protein F [Nitrosospira sp. Nsp11]